MEKKLIYIGNNSVYFIYYGTKPYMTSFHVLKNGNINAICECLDTIYRKRECKHIKDARNSDEVKDLMKNKVEK